MLVRHDHQPSKPTDDFFAPPDPAIGDVQSGYTSATRGKKSSMLAFLVAPIVGGLGFFVSVLTIGRSLKQNVELAVPLCIGVGLVALVGTFLLLKRRGDEESCSYVGRKGAVRYRRVGSSVVQSELLLYASIAGIDVKVTERIGPGSIKYETAWIFRDSTDTAVATIRATHYPGNLGDIRWKPDDTIVRYYEMCAPAADPSGEYGHNRDYWFARRTHEAWTRSKMLEALPARGAQSV